MSDWFYGGMSITNKSNEVVDTPAKDFDLLIARTEYHTRHKHSAVVITPREHIPERG